MTLKRTVFDIRLKNLAKAAEAKFAEAPELSADTEELLVPIGLCEATAQRSAFPHFR